MRETIEAITREVARDVLFYYPTAFSGCSLCSLDPITDTSTDSFCQQCGGDYWIPVFSGVTMSGKVSWGKSENKDWQTGGLIDTGDCLVTVLHSTQTENIIFSSEYVTVDGRELDVKNIILRGTPAINRILIVLKEKERM
jgi:hypothetical protein